MKFVSNTAGMIGIACCLVAACGERELPPEPLRPVLTQVVGQSALDLGAQYSGEVRSRTETPLGFRVGGKLMSRTVEAGTVVTQGQELARLDPADNAAQALAAKSQADLAAADLARYRELRARNFVSQAALDAKETAYKGAKAQADVVGNQSSYTILKAEYPGVITQVTAEVGQVVSPGQMVYRLARPDQPEVVIAIPESRVADLKSGAEASISLWVDEQQGQLRGRLRELSPVADAVTRTYTAKVALLNPDPRVRLGMTAYVNFARSDPSLKVPLAAIFQQGEKTAVWVVADDQTVHLRPVAISAWREEGALLAGGLKQGERIVIAGVHKLTEGEKIKVATEARP